MRFEQTAGLYSFTHSGVTYLLNILFEYGVPIYRNKFKNFWIKNRKSSFYLSDCEKIDLGIWFPKFQTDQNHTFSNKLRLFWTHDFPEKHLKSEKSIIMFRDPKDTLYSAYHRVGQTSWSDYLQSSFPGDKLYLVPQQAWAFYYLSLIEKLKSTPTLIVSFEKLKKEPFSEMLAIIEFLNIPLNIEKLHSAIQASSFDQVKVATELWYQKYPQLKKSDWKAMRKGQVNEACNHTLLPLTHLEQDCLQALKVTRTISTKILHKENAHQTNIIKYYEQSITKIIKIHFKAKNPIFIKKLIENIYPTTEHIIMSLSAIYHNDSKIIENKLIHFVQNTNNLFSIRCFALDALAPHITQKKLNFELKILEKSIISKDDATIFELLKKKNRYRFFKIFKSAKNLY